MIKGDRAALEKLLADDLTYTHSSALFESKEQFIKSVTSGNIDYVSIVPSESDWKVRVNGNTAIVNGVAAVNVIDTGKDLKIKIRYTTIHTNRAAAGSCRRGRRRDSRRKAVLLGARRALACGATRACPDCVALRQTDSTPRYLSHAQAGPVFAALDAPLPAAGDWPRWIAAADAATRARVARGDEASVVNLLLFGTSFTSHPRITSRQLNGEQIRKAVDARLDDFSRALAQPGANERLQYARSLLVGGAPPRARLLSMIDSTIQEGETLARLTADAERLGDPSLEFAERSRLYRDRGLSLGHLHPSQLCRSRRRCGRRDPQAGR